MTIKKKTCGNCNNEYPKTTEYFFIRKIKQKLSTGEIAVYNSFRSNCIKCHKIKAEKRRVEKRCKELNCDVKDYRKNWKQQYTETRTIDLYSKEKLTQGQYGFFRTLLKANFVADLESYFKRVIESKKQRNERIRNEALSKKKYFTKEDKRLALRMYAKNDKDRLTDSYISNQVMKKNISELSPEIIETKRLTIQLKRELKINNIKIR